MNGTQFASQPASKLLDDLLRRELRVGDPRSAKEMSEALRRKYAGEARRIDQEASGLPVLVESAGVPYSVPASGPTSTGSNEEKRMTEALDADLAQLIQAPGNREWRPELRGWRGFLTQEFAEATAAARFAQDPAQRQRGFLGVRRLGEYARVARLVSVVHPAVACDFRRLATTLDGAAATIRILLGEALYSAGLAEGGVIVSVPVVEIRERRQGLLQSLRRLIGVTPDTGEDWGFASASYEALTNKLDAYGWPELQTYLREEGMSVALDRLVNAASRRDPEALRQLASTHTLEVLQLEKLLRVAIDLLNGQRFFGDEGDKTRRESAALSAFVQALSLFLSAFKATRSGARLIDLAVPISLAASQSDEADGEARRRLRELVSFRAEFAREIECFLECCCGEQEERVLQVQLDKGLYDIDRCIDLYAQGEADTGHEEIRAAAYSPILKNLWNETPRRSRLERVLEMVIRTLSFDDLRAEDALDADERMALRTAIRDVNIEQHTHESTWQELVRTLAPRCAANDDLLKAGVRLLESPLERFSKRFPEDTTLSVMPVAAAATRIARKLDECGVGGRTTSKRPKSWRREEADEPAREWAVADSVAEFPAVESTEPETPDAHLPVAEPVEPPAPEPIAVPAAPAEDPSVTAERLGYELVRAWISGRPERVEHALDVVVSEGAPEPARELARRLDPKGVTREQVEELADLLVPPPPETVAQPIHVEVKS